ncbi:HSP70 nucleotide exchange factor FES1-like protein, partial [Tanacetum coccineum]
AKEVYKDVSRVYVTFMVTMNFRLLFERWEVGTHEEDHKWFMEAMQAQTIDVVKRMKDITLVMQTHDNVLEEQGVSASDLEGMLDELQEHVEPIDMANDHHTIRGLPPLLKYLSNSHANIRAKAAEVELNERPVHVSLATARVTRTELGCISWKKRLIRLWIREENDIAIVTHNGFLFHTLATFGND